jgi:hypothetical protein
MDSKIEMSQKLQCMNLHSPLFFKRLQITIDRRRSSSFWGLGLGVKFYPNTEARVVVAAVVNCGFHTSDLVQEPQETSSSASHESNSTRGIRLRSLLHVEHGRF